MIFSKTILAQEDVIILDENSSKRSVNWGIGANVEVWICVVLKLQLDLTIYWGVQKIGCTTNLKPLIEIHDRILISGESSFPKEVVDSRL